nr:trypsin-like peptidase domain-containing protein [uncultured Roseibium sp.]
MEETNGGGSPESVEGFNYFRAATAGFQHDILGPTQLRDRPDAGFFSDGGASLPQAQPEKVIGFDNRKRITDTSLTPWRCICHLEVQYDRGPVGFGTGFLAGRSLVVTAAHVLVDRSLYGWDQKPRMAERVRIAPGRDETLAPYGALVVDIPTKGKNHLIPDVWKDVAKTSAAAVALEQRAIVQDYAGIRVDQAVGERLGYFGLRDTDEFDDADKGAIFVNTAGYPHVPAKPYGTLWYNAGRTSNGSPNDAFIDYMVDTEGGQSGSPVYFFDKRAGQRYVLAIHTTGDFVNRGLSLRGEVYDTIVGWRGHD